MMMIAAALKKAPLVRRRAVNAPLHPETGISGTLSLLSFFAAFGSEGGQA
jgi:hypothetical protein